MVASGMRDAGYVSTVNIDDTWEGVPEMRKADLDPNEKFPDFMEALALKYVHSKGLKLGDLLLSAGPRTCADYPEAAMGMKSKRMQKPLRHGASDYLKYDWCGARIIYSNDSEQALYQKMGDALLKSGRPIVYSLCQYGVRKV